MSVARPEAWPTATLDPLTRLRVLAGVLPGVHLIERQLDAPYERVWSFVSDIERSVPLFDAQVRRMKVVGRAGGRLRVVAFGPLSAPLPFLAGIGDGFLWLQAPLRIYVVGMAAIPVGDGTLLAHLEGTPAPGGRLRARWLRRHVEADVAGIERVLREGLD